MSVAPLAVLIDRDEVDGPAMTRSPGEVALHPMSARADGLRLPFYRPPRLRPGGGGGSAGSQGTAGQTGQK
jgi:hypothetical protein